MSESPGRSRSDGRDRMRSESRERFLREILARIPAERIGEVHVFPAIRQGGVETGIAVIATTERDAPSDEPGEAPALREPASKAGGPEAVQDTAPGGTYAVPPGEMEIACELAGAADQQERPVRITVYTARYRQTLKGADRGSWEFDLVAEADAPLVTVEAVVRGVHKRSGELADAERLTAEAIRAFIDEPWHATTG